LPRSKRPTGRKINCDGSAKRNLVFFAVIRSIILQGPTLGLVAKWLELAEPARPPALFNLEVLTMTRSD